MILALTGTGIFMQVHSSSVDHNQPSIPNTACFVDEEGNMQRELPPGYILEVRVRGSSPHPPAI